jgi:hypothetical protein
LWSRLYFDLAAYLTERSADDTALLTFSHRQFPGSKRWRASIRRSNGRFFPTIPDDSMGFEASEFAQKTLFFLGAAKQGFRLLFAGPATIR